MLLQDDIKAIEERAKAATGGLWDADGGCIYQQDDAIGKLIARNVEFDDAVFITNARTDVLSLVELVRTLLHLYCDDIIESDFDLLWAESKRKAGVE